MKSMVSISATEEREWSKSFYLPHALPPAGREVSENETAWVLSVPVEEKNIVKHGDFIIMTWSASLEELTGFEFKVYTYEEDRKSTEMEDLERAKQDLWNIGEKIRSGKNLSREELRRLVEIDILADRHRDNYPELKRGVRELLLLIEKITPAEVVSLKKGEIREIDDNTLIRRRKDGVVEVLILKE